MNSEVILKPRRGRPPKNPDEALNNGKLTFYIEPPRALELRATAKENGLGIAQFCRMAVYRMINQMKQAA